MRRALALAALIVLSSAGAAFAEHWTKFADGANGIEWSYDADYSYKDSYWKRETQLKEASESLKYLRGSMPAAFDGFVLGDWNIPQPMSMSSEPKWPGGSSTNIIPGKPDLTAAADPNNPFAMYNQVCSARLLRFEEPDLCRLGGKGV